MNDPDMILRVHRDADGLAHDPMVGQRLGPQRIDLEARRGDGGGFHHRMFLQQKRSDTQRASKCQETETSISIALHVDQPSSRNTRGIISD